MTPIERWTRYSRSKKSLAERTVVLERFFQFVGKSDVELIEVAKQDYPMQVRINDWVLQYLDSRHDRDKIATSSCCKEGGVISGFFHRNGVVIQLPTDKYPMKPVFESTRLLEQKDVAMMISKTKGLDRQAVICVNFQSGQRIAILPALRYNMITRYPDKDGKVYGIVEVKPEIRNRTGELVNKTRTHYTFCLHWQSMSLLDNMRKGRDDWIWQFNKRNMQYIIPKAAESAGIQRKTETGRKDRDWHEVHAHVCRRFLKHQLRLGGVQDRDLLEYLIGHKVPSHGTYDVFPPEIILEAYHKAEWYLRVLP